MKATEQQADRSEHLGFQFSREYGFCSRTGTSFLYFREYPEIDCNVRVIKELNPYFTSVNEEFRNPEDCTIVEVNDGATGSELLDFIAGNNLENVVLVERLDYKVRYFEEFGKWYADVDEHAHFCRRLRLMPDHKNAVWFYSVKIGAYRIMPANTLYAFDPDKDFEDHDFDADHVFDPVPDTSAIISHEIDNDGEFMPIDFQ